MNNEQRNTYVKRQLTAALLELLEEKDLRDISVSEIAAAAGVHRVSFYRSFQEKEDILRDHMNATYQEWEKSRTPPAREEGVRDLFAYLARNGALYRLLYERAVSYYIYKIIRSVIKKS